LYDVQREISKKAKTNFLLEKQIREVDEKIKLLVQNQLSVQEAMSSVSRTEEEKTATISPLKGKRGKYEELFYHLQGNPHYLGAVAPLVQSGESSSQFVQLVVYDLYGDQYDTREERLLLALFRQVIKQEMDRTSSHGSLLRATNVVTTMLSEYARRGTGLRLLKDALSEPLRKIALDSSLNLEVNPVTVYRQIITDKETETGESLDLPQNVDAEAALEYEGVRETVEARLKKLQETAQEIIQRMLLAHESIPYGVRWICKQLGELSREKFPDITELQVTSLMGGYICLRFFNPVIVSPDAHGFVRERPSKRGRRNLVLVAKVIQTLSNGVLFGDKEKYMVPLNPFVESMREDWVKFFDRLIAIDDVDDALEVDKYIEHATRLSTLQLSYNQIFLVHRLLEQHLDSLVPDEDDPVRIMIKDLGPAPEKVSREDNRHVVLNLQDRRTTRLSTAKNVFEKGDNSVNPLYFQARSLLLSVLRLLPSEAPACSTLEEFLSSEKQKAVDLLDMGLADHISNVMAMLSTLSDMKLLKTRPTRTETLDYFLWELSSAVLSREERLVRAEKRLKMVHSALQTVEEHNKSLNERLDVYKLYLESVRSGGSNQPDVADSKKDKPKKYKVSHNDLLEKKVIMEVDPSIPVSVLKKCYYIFEMTGSSTFQISLHMKKLFDVRLTNKPIVIELEDLLKMQEKGEQRLELEHVVLNANLVVHLLNSKFLAKK